MAIQGVVVYNSSHEGVFWEKVISLENFNEQDYLIVSDTAKISYKIYDSLNVKSAAAMLLWVELKEDFIENMNDEEI